MRTIMLTASGFGLFVLGLCTGGSANAEGQCPPGYYPMVGQGVIACAPIPQDRPLNEVEPPRWHTRYGGLAYDEQSGLVIGVRKKRSAADASEAALSECERKAGRPCKSLGTWSNGCIVAMRPVGLTGQPLVNYGRSVGEARSVPARVCADKGFKCEVVYSGCVEASWF